MHAYTLIHTVHNDLVNIIFYHVVSFKTHTDTHTHTPQGLGFQIPFSMKRNQDSLEKCLFQGWGRENIK